MNSFVFNSKESFFPKIDLTDEEIALCKKFSEDHAKKANSYDHWSDRSASGVSEDKCFYSNILGKSAEFVAYKTLKKFCRFNDLSCPDLEIYSGSNRSFDPDLKCGKSRFCVKGCNRDIVSWVIQKQNGSRSGGRDQFFFSENPIGNVFSCFVLMSNDCSYGRLMAFVPNSVLILNKEVFYEDMLYKDYKNTKKAIYWQTLVENNLSPSRSKICSALKREFLCQN